LITSSLASDFYSDRHGIPIPGRQLFSGLCPNG